MNRGNYKKIASKIKRMKFNKIMKTLKLVRTIKVEKLISIQTDRAAYGNEAIRTNNRIKNSH